MAATSAAKKSSPVNLPIDDFDRLSIKQIEPLLKTLSSRDLKAVTAYEKAGKNRVTLLRAVRKIELARETARSQKPAKTRLVVVEEDIEPEVAAAVPEAPPAPPAPPAPSAKAPAAKAPAAKAPAVSAAKTSGSRRSRNRPPVKAATWEEEIQPQLPRRYAAAAAAFDLEFDSPTITMDPPESILSVPTGPAFLGGDDDVKSMGKASVPTSRAPRVATAKKKFENVALVMAAILAVLLGLAIGTVLARSGSTDPTPPARASQAAVVQTAG